MCRRYICRNAGDFRCFGYEEIMREPRTWWRRIFIFLRAKAKNGYEIYATDAKISDKGDGKTLCRGPRIGSG